MPERKVARAMGKSNEAKSVFHLSNFSFPESKKEQMCGRFLVDTSLSSSLIPSNSTRHSVTSRIERNSRVLNYLIFSTRQLNATPEKRN
jgi:hypothetical protein